MTDEVIKVEAKELKVGRFVVIDDIPCKVVSIEVSKPGKHGSAKMRVTAIGIFDNQKKTLLVPTDASVEVPVVKKRTAQVLAINGNIANVMDKDNYETFDVIIPDELKNEVAEGKEIEVMEALGRKAVLRVFKE
ncbi:MAG: translation initiation factor IF-5A [Candidatus Anstonellales archaeon]